MSQNDMEYSNNILSSLVNGARMIILGAANIADGIAEACEILLSSIIFCSRSFLE